MAGTGSTDISAVKIGFIGIGNMAQAIIEGWFKANVIKPGQLMASAPSDRNFTKAKEWGIRTTHDNCELARSCQVIILACKPYHIPQVSAQIRSEVGGDKLIISLTAGTAVPSLEVGLLDGTRLVRAMPNVASSVCAGVTMLVRGTYANDEDVSLTRAIFEPIGLVEEGTDAMLNIVSGFGSTPAYLAIVLEALSDGAVKMGMPRHLSTKLAAQVMMGTGKLQLETGLHPALIKDSVCSPNGSTIRGVHAMEKGGVRAAIIDAFEASVNRSSSDLSK